MGGQPLSLDTLSSQRAAEGGEALSRREIYRRTKGYSILGVEIAKISAAMSILFIIAILKNLQHLWESDILGVYAILVAAALFSNLRYWKHWLDIFKKDLVLFEGEVFSEGAEIGRAHV